MKSYTSGHVKMAMTAVRANRFRSFLTMLGIIIGVASVITVVSIGEGVKHQVQGQINKLGKDLITERADTLTSSSPGLGLLSTFGVASPLPEKDYATVATTRGVKLAVPLTLVDGQVSGDQSPSNNVVIGTTDQFAGLLNQPLAYGTFFNSDESDAHVAVLGERAAIRLFNENVPLGRSITFRGQEFVVRGIFDPFDITPLSGEADFNDAVFIPYAQAQELTSHAAPLYEVLARPNDPKQTDRTVAAIKRRLAAAHGDVVDFSVFKSTQSLAATNTILDLLTRLIAGIAAVSLLVGGVGIMNVMLVSVTERMREVGIRKAVGATNRQILSQFMIEATVLSLLGGIIGVVVAGIGSLLLRIFTSLQPVITWQIVVLATLVSMAVGVIFGSIPALKAARKTPIDALRNE